MPRSIRGPTRRYVAAVAAVAAATAARLAVDPWLGDRVPFITYFAAVAVAARYGGLGPSALAVALSVPAASCFVLHPRGSLAVEGAEAQVGPALFLLVGSALALMGGSMRAARIRAEVSEAAARRALEAERAQRERLRVTLASIGDAVITTDAGGRVEVLNPVAERITGWTAAEAAGRPMEEVFRIVGEETGEPAESPVASVLREGVVVGLANHTALVARDGTERPIEDSAAPIRYGSGSVGGVVLVFRDVTDRRRAEREGLRRQALQEAILGAALDAIVTIDHEGHVVEWNSAAEGMFGLRRAEAVGREMAGLIIPPAQREAHRKGLARYLATGEGPVLGRRIEVTALRADGTEFPAELAIVPISTGGEPLFTAHLRDITQREAVETRRNARLAITESLAGAASIGEAAPAILRAACEGLGWDVGLLWLLDEEVGCLRCLDAWGRPSAATDRFVDASRSRTYALGEGLPGRAWDTGRAAWVPDVTVEPNFPRAPTAVEAGLHGAFAAPITAGGRVLGLVEFFSGEVREPDPDLLEMMTTLGGQVGQFIERRRAEERLRRGERDLADFFERATVGLHWVGPDGKILRANRAELDLLGYTEQEYVGRNIAEFHADEGVIRDILNRLGAGETLHDYPARLRHKDGSIREVRIDSSVKWEGGRFVHTRCFTRDVTGARRAEAALRDSEERFRTMAESIPQLAWMARPDGHIYWYNRRWYDYTGTTPEQMEGWGWQQVHDPDVLPEVLERWGASLASGEPFDMVFPLKGADGRFRPFLTRVMPVRGEDGRVAQWFGTNTDISERVAMEEALKEADRRKDKFLATLAHELRNPLAPIRTALHLMGRTDGERREFEAERAMAERQVAHLARLVDDLMDVARMTQGSIELRTEVLDLADIVGRAVESARPAIEERGLHLTVELPDRTIPLEADPTRLEQALSNLLNNAIKYTEPGGRISVVAGAEGGEAVLRVRDTGVGIAPEMLPHVFDMFVQAERRLRRSQGGLGIGLGLVKSLVELHGGSVEALSEGPGRGSEFVVRLPIFVGMQDESEGGRGASDEDPPADPPSRRILVVDDNEDAADSLARFLRRLYGYEVELAYDGPAALAAAERFRPDVILLDIGLPGLSGFEVAERLRSRAEFLGTLIVAVTGWGQEDDRRRSREVGIDIHLVKPVDLPSLQELIASGSR